MAREHKQRNVATAISAVAGLALLVVAFMSTVHNGFDVDVRKPSALVDAAATHDDVAETATQFPPSTIVPRNWTRQRGRRYVWLDVAIDGVPIGRITTELYMDLVPKTAENFRALVTGDNVPGYSYKKSKCHRILKGFIVQCGDFEYGKGYGGKSIYGGDDTFEDEKAGLELTHSKRYILQMANYGPNTNKSQFCIMLAPSPGLNGHHVVFGEVVDGFHVVDAMEAAGVSTDDEKLVHEVILVDGGEIYD